MASLYIEAYSTNSRTINKLNENFWISITENESSKNILIK